MPAPLPQLPVWSAPLVPVALAMTAGVMLDRWLIVPLAVSLGVLFLCLAAAIVFSGTRKRALTVLYLWASLTALGAVLHHGHRHHVAPGDLSFLVSSESLPLRLRGILHSTPHTTPAKRDPLRSFATKATTRFVLRASDRQDLTTRHWQPASGLVQVTLIGALPEATIGDELELLGRLALPAEPMNPGEFDYASFLRDQGITTTLVVLDPNQVTVTRPPWPTTPFGWLAAARAWGQHTLERELGPRHEIAAALLLGEGSGMTGDAWEQYLRTGVIHVLAISGQHLAVLAGFLWILARGTGVRRRHAAIAITLILLAYALMTGGRPPVMRAAWMVAAYTGAILLRRPVSHANTFALAWIGVLVVNPTDIFTGGCQLSFLAVAVLLWGAGRWGEQPEDPLERVLDASRPWWLRLLLAVGRWLLMLLALNAMIWLAASPLTAWHYHLVSPIALVLGPPLVILTSIALVSGFLLLLVAAWLWPLALLFSGVTQACLYGCEAMVSIGQRAPGAYFFVADVPAWWLGVFYLGLLVGITSPLHGRYGRWAIALGAVWLLLGVAMQLAPHRPGELRCTFVAVGHGGCTVIETPNGRVLVYDAGANSGPDVTRRYIAPFLWSRGIRHIDELILSHADLDHFNGVPQLADRFSIGRVISTPSFDQRELAAVQKTLEALTARGLGVEVVARGQRWELDGVALEVLHPPARGPAGKENARSLVLLVRHGGWSMLLTGDLEDEGLKQVLANPLPAVSVLMAPHHGSDKSNIPELAKRTQPKLVISSQAEPTSERLSIARYEKAGARFLGTWPHGAITIRPGASPAVETYRTKQALAPF